ncbi:MAG: GHKL domain-containing protein [Lachnospiraceae bacterium]
MKIHQAWKPLIVYSIFLPLCIFINFINTDNEIFIYLFYNVFNLYLLVITFFCLPRIFPSLKKSSLILLYYITLYSQDTLFILYGYILKSWFPTFYDTNLYLRYIIFGPLSVVIIPSIIKLLQKYSNIINYFRELFNNTKFTVTAIVLLQVAYINLNYFASMYQQSIDYNFKVAFVLLIVFLITLLFLLTICAREISIKEQMRRSQDMIVQQQAHLDELEHIQKELRIIHHDYKNLISGLYIQAEEGNTEEIKHYISDKLLKIDSDVQQEIKQMNYLSQIHSIELKSLLLTKLSKIKIAKISFTLEVMNPVTQLHMDLIDFIRCTGILLDNAIEETQKQAHGQIIMVLLQESDHLTMLVKNSLQDTVDLQKLNQYGYSTKGNNRGFGLHSYLQILNKYPYITHITKAEDGFFSQALYVSNP